MSGWFHRAMPSNGRMRQRALVVAVGANVAAASGDAASHQER